MPFFRQLAHHVRNQIHAGTLAAGTRLPPQRLLARQLGVNRSTIVAAYQELQADGLLIGQSGGGTVVRSATGSARDALDWHDLLDRGAYVQDRSLAAEVAQARTLHDSISLAHGELGADLRPTAAIRQLFHQAPVCANWLGYEGAHGYQPLREAIAERMTARGGAYGTG